MGVDATSVLDRFWDRVETSEGCWRWTGPLHPYGLVSTRGRGRMRAHVFSWEYHNRREVSSGKIVRHLCGNKACVRPEHLAEGTRKDNADDGLRLGEKRVGGTPYHKTGVRAIAYSRRYRKR